jgi:arylsulfatase A-like enzyme
MAPHAESPRGERNGFLDGVGSIDAPTRPNILYIMADQLAAPLLKMHDPESVIQTPNLDKLAESGVVFDKAYCNSPLCAPSRFCMVTGQLPSKVGVCSLIPTLFTCIYLISC